MKLRYCWVWASSLAVLGCSKKPSAEPPAAVGEIAPVESQPAVAPHGPEVTAAAPDIAPTPQPEAPDAAPAAEVATGNGVERLTQELGQGGAVAVLPWPTGLMAMSADGVRRETLVDGPVGWAAVDHDAQIIWFGRHIARPEGEVAKDLPEGDLQELMALDLLANKAEPRRLATNLPRDVRFAVRYEDAREGRRNPVMYLGRRLADGIDLVLDPENPRLESSEGVYTELGLTAGPGVPERRSGFPAETVAWLKGVVSRPTPDFERPACAVAASEIPETIKVPGCTDSEYCGQVKRFEGTALWQVVAEVSCGDTCHFETNLYDPVAKVWVSRTGVRQDKPFGEAESLHATWVGPDCRGFVMDGVLWRLDGAPTRPEGAGPVWKARGGGWLGGHFFNPE